MAGQRYHFTGADDLLHKADGKLGEQHLAAGAGVKGEGGKQRRDILHQSAGAGLLDDVAVGALPHHQVHGLIVLGGVLLHDKARNVAQCDIQIVLLRDEAHLLPGDIAVVAELEYPTRNLQGLQDPECGGRA